MSLTHLDLFSGIGGFALAARWTGWTTIGFSEIDPYCCKVLRKHWPDVPNYGDVRTVPAVRCELITGGFPCQPFSCAGKRRGTADDRHLWPAMLAVIERCRPAWVLGENVPGIVGMVLSDCIADLENRGFWVAPPFLVPAGALGAPHIRERIWLVAHSMQKRERRKSRETAIEEVARHSDSLRGLESEGSKQDERRRHLHSDWWETSPEPPRVDDGIPDGSYRRDCLGNAIVPQVAAVFLDAIARAHNH